jgi:hypothetical protein
MSFILKDIPVVVHIFENLKENKFTAFTTDIGGPVITTNSEQQTKDEFAVAMRLSSAIKNFLYFKGANRANSQMEKMQYIEGMKERVGEIEYITEMV